MKCRLSPVQNEEFQDGASIEPSVGTSERGLCGGLGHTPVKPTVTVCQVLSQAQEDTAKETQKSPSSRGADNLSGDLLRGSLVDLSEARCPGRPAPPGPAAQAAHGELGTHRSNG